MKLPKKVYLVAAVLLFTAGGGTALALQPEPAPTKEFVQQTAATKPVEVQSATTATTEPVETPPPVVEPVVQEQPPVEPQETLQEKIKREVEAVAVSLGMNDEAKWGAGRVEMQSRCMDRFIASNGGYENNTNWATLLDIYMNGRPKENGTTHMYFEGACRVMYFTVLN